MKNSVLETIVGFTVILVAFSFLSFGYLSTFKTIPHGLVYKAVFDSIEGIMVNSDVKIGGVRVGNVSSIDFTKDKQILVSVQLRKDLELPTDSTVAVVTAGLMGDKYIAISLGGSSDFLKPGETFICAQSPLSLESLVNKLITSFSQKSSESTAKK
ncbi:outer membrane lipid asymmetry maintenance protein MlaD [Alphaproteobacteria bacterium]|nr:outer membrane lipid asymmetry maintenance protein MlaD [Alphaproteobacteria bacterium]GHS98146.1 outer membrane lipid asymmetry maintenance protein MlaD [Alphaproteobacteria bacterium]